MNTTPVRILLVDDHRLFSEGLAALLSGYPHVEVCGHACSINDAKNKIHNLKPDLILLDININGESSLEFGENLLRQGKSKVMLVTMYNQEKLVKEAKRAGFHGYLLKDSSKEEILMSISEISAGRLYFDSKALSSSQDDTDLEDDFSRKQRLTFREKELIKLLKTGRTNEEIANELHLSVLTIKAHRRNIHFKLGVRNAVELINYANQNDL
jgi:DNA-binding NarL/FixJ family response regulator